MPTYKQRLVEAMGKKNMSVDRLVEASGVSRSAIYSYLNRNAIPNAYTLGCLADTLGVTMDWLWGR